jgi:tRNA(fMet)-specific endonuclease VapC
MKYLLDTNTVSFAMRGVGDVGENLLKHEPESIFVSSITEAELWFGVEKRGSKKLEKIVTDFLKPLNIIDFRSGEARVFGELFSKLEKKGMTIGVTDTMIASIAMNNDLVLVTDNTKHFKRLKGLSIENWA